MKHRTIRIIAAVTFLFTLGAHRARADLPIFEPPVELPDSIIVHPIDTTHTDTMIDFENRSAGERIYTEYADVGVAFPLQPYIVTPSVATSSGTTALTTHAPGEEFDNEPLRMRFVRGQKTVSMKIGLDYPTGGHTIAVTLRAMNARGDTIDVTTTTLGPGPSPITTPVSVGAATYAIRTVELDYQITYSVYMDDLWFDNCTDWDPGDTTAPTVTIDTPVDGDYIDFFANGEAFPLDGTVYEETKLKQLSIVVTSGTDSMSGTLHYSGTGPEHRFGAPYTHMIYEGHNTIVVTAEDHGGNRGSDTVSVWYEPLEGDAELLILTPGAFREPYVAVRDWKRSTGIASAVMTLEAVAMDPRFSGGRDVQERIKMALAHAYRHHGTRYVMLVGDGDRFPIRFTRIGREGVSWGVCWPASELYYADLFKQDGGFDDWDGNGNGVFGEWWAPATEGSGASDFASINIDDCDLKPDIALGRVPASTLAEATRYAGKIIAYEMNEPGAWFDNVLLFDGHDSFDSDQANLDWIADNTLGGSHFIKKYRPAGYESWDTSQRIHYNGQWADQITTAINRGAGFVVCFDHGAPWQIGAYGATHLADLDNAQHLPVVLASACDAAKFYQINDYYQSIYGSFPPAGQIGWADPRPEPAPIQPAVVDNESMAERLLVQDVTGAIGFIGSHSGVNACSHRFARRFPEAWDAGHQRLGDMWNYAVKKYVTDDLETNTVCGTSDFYSHYIHKYSVFGDPSIRLGGIPGSDLASVVGPQRVVPAGVSSTADFVNRFEMVLSTVHAQPVSDDKSAAISGEAAGGAHVAVYAGGSLLNSTTAGTAGGFSLLISGLDEGMNRLRVVATKGEDVDSCTVGLLVQTVAPRLTRLSVRENENGGVVVSGATGSDATWVAVRQGSTVLAGDYCRNGGAFIIALDSLPDGCGLYLRDAAGQVTVLTDTLRVGTSAARSRSTATARRSFALRHAKAALRLTFGQPGLKHVSLTTVRGRRVMAASSEGDTMAIPTASLAAGAYVLRVVGREGVRVSTLHLGR
jgi:hypothetical protein